MKLKGDILALRRLFENEQAVRAGEKTPHRILLVTTGGGMCCIRTAAYLTAWRDAGLEAALDHAVSVSGSGGPVGAYLSGIPDRAVQVFEQLAVTNFIEKKPWFKHRMDLRQLGDALRGKNNPVGIDDANILAHRTSWHVAVTRLTGESFLLDTRKATPDVTQAILASCAFPKITDPIFVGTDGREEAFVDGACGLPMPVTTAIRKFRPDTVIVLASRPLPKHLPICEQWLWPLMAKTFLHQMPKMLRNGAAAMNRGMAAEADRLSRLKKIRWCRITPNASEVSILPMTSDILMLRKAADEAKCFMRDALAQAKPARQI